MKINANKTKILACSRDNKVRTRIKLKYNETIEQVKNFIYLGSTEAQIGDLIRKVVFLIKNLSVIA
jgi:hypothetical protein